MPGPKRTRLKDGVSGRFLSQAEADAIVALEQAAYLAATSSENVDPNVQQPSSMVIVTGGEARGGSRRVDTCLDERTRQKIRRLESDLEAERSRSQNLVASVKAARNEVVAARDGTTTMLSQALEKSIEKNRLQASELSKVRDQLRKSRDATMEARAQAAARAAKAAQRIRSIIMQRSAARNDVTGVQSRNVKSKTQVPAEGSSNYDRARYDYIRNHALKLQAWLEDTFSDGTCGESALEVLTYFLDHHTSLARNLIVKLEIPQAIEAEVVRHLQANLTTEKAASMRSSTGMTWEGYRQYSSSLFTEWCPVRCKNIPIGMPYGGQPPQPVKTWKLIDHEKEIFKVFGLKQSQDGVTAWCDIKKMLELRLESFPRHQLPAKDECIQLFFGADAFRMYKQNSTKAVLCVCKIYLERLDDDGNRLEGWALNSKDNNLKMAIYEGSDCYKEFTTKGSIAQKQITKLVNEGLTVNNNTYKVKMGLFGDMAFLDSVLGGSGCGSDRPCIHCDVSSKYLMWKKATFQDEHVPSPTPRTLEARTKLSHAFGAEFGLETPYECPGCHKTISRHLQYPPISQAEEAAYRAQHSHQQHGRPPPQLPFSDIVACSMHGEHNLLAQTWYATVQCNLWDANTANLVAKVVNEDWKMKRFTITRNTGKKALTKDTPHFNGPEGKVVLARREEVLSIVSPPGHTDHELVRAIWEVQDRLFHLWHRPTPVDPADWEAAGDEAQKAAEDYVDLFTLLCSAADGTVTMHYAMFHWPDIIRKFGSLAGLNAQGLEAANQECKGDSKKRSNRQTVRLLGQGLWSRGRAAQLLAKSITRVLARTQANVQKVLVRHVLRKPTEGNPVG